MSAEWPYAQLTHNARLAGGPELYLDMLVEGGKRLGITEGIASQRPIIAGVGLAGIAIGGLIAYLISGSGRLKADDILEERKNIEKIKREFAKLVNSDDDKERFNTQLEEDNEKPDVTLEELKARYDALVGDADIPSEESDEFTLKQIINCEDDDFEEPVATRLSFDDDLFTYMAGIDICEEDKPLIRLVRNHPAYSSFARRYHTHEPEAGELQTVKAFIRTMAYYAEEDSHEIPS